MIDFVLQLYCKFSIVSAVLKKCPQSSFEKKKAFGLPEFIEILQYLLSQIA
jgi:hypothetical protein